MASRESVPVTIPATQAHRKFGDLIRRVFKGEEHFVVERDGLPVAAIISISEYEELIQERQRRQERLTKFQQAARSIGEEFQRRGLSEEDVLEALEKTREEVYQEHYGRDQSR